MKNVATVGGGCYWCLEAFYKLIEGVINVQAGYSGGSFENPTDQDVYGGNTGHAEVVQVTFDSSILTYREILEIFFVMHDPTTLNRQDYDIGEIYRSVIYYHDENQHSTALAMITDFASKLYKNPIVTQLEPYGIFWPADESMQDFYGKNPNAGYCIAVIDPKIQKLRQKFAKRIRN